MFIACFVVVRFQDCLKVMSTPLWWLSVRKVHKEKDSCSTAARSCTNGSLSRLVWDLAFLSLSLSISQFEREIVFESYCVLSMDLLHCLKVEHFSHPCNFFTGHEQLACCFHYESIFWRSEESSSYISSLVQQVDFGLGKCLKVSISASVLTFSGVSVGVFSTGLVIGLLVHCIKLAKSSPARLTWRSPM